MSLDDSDRATSSSLSARFQLSTEKIFAIDKFLKFRKGKGAQTLPFFGSEEGRAATDSNNPDDGPTESSRSVDLPSADLGNEVMDTEGNREATGSTTFVEKMQAMIPTLPSFPFPVMSPSQTSFASSPQQEPLSPSSNPILPAADSLTKVWGFLSPRSSNRSMEPDSRSLLSALDLLQSPRGRELANGLASPTESTSAVLDCVDDNNSVMVYGPLEPDNTSEVEIACSEIVSVYGDGEEIRTPQSRFIPLPAESIEQVLMGATETLEKGKASERESVDDSSAVPWVPPNELWKSPLSRGGQLPEREYRVWVPSLTKISVQTMWWGFRIYLPPPVLDILNNKQLQAAKRAAIITGALKWLMDHIPLPLLPPQDATSCGNIASTCTLSWICRWFDCLELVWSQGTVLFLQATWLLPIALIPGTWEADDFPA
ncbi:hypothetical protein F5141DRAFT_1211407 [Pisolithus sp. B1]|nr:hypothetical protein F5141DRAFT_1211407 [Pisolithus sp. B1]